MTWQDLSSDELQARLEQRGETPATAAWLVIHRECDDCQAPDLITSILENDDG